MDKKEVIEIGELIQEAYVKYLKFNKYNALFDQEVTYQIFFDDYKSEGYELTDKIMHSLDFFLQFDESKLNWMKQLCFKHFEMCIAVTDYGIDYELLEKHNNDFGKANKELFNIYTAETAFERTTIDSVNILEQENDGVMNIYLTIECAVPWEEEHGMRIHFMNNMFTEVE